MQTSKLWRRRVFVVAFLVVAAAPSVFLLRKLVTPFSQCGEDIAPGTLPHTLVAAFLAQEDPSFFALSQSRSPLARSAAALCYSSQTLTFLYEHFAQREDVLRAYLTLTPFGDDVTGIVEAARARWGKDVVDLTEPEQRSLVQSLRAAPHSRGVASLDEETLRRREADLLREHRSDILALPFVHNAEIMRRLWNGITVPSRVFRQGTELISRARTGNGFRLESRFLTGKLRWAIDLPEPVSGGTIDEPQKRMAFFQSIGARRTFRLMVIDLDTGKEIFVGERLTWKPSFAWAPKGTTFLYEVEDAKTRELRLADAATPSKPYRVIAQNLSEEASFSWSPDGRWVAVSEGDKAVSVTLYPITAFEPPRKVPLSRPFSGMRWLSPRQLVIRGKNSEHPDFGYVEVDIETGATKPFVEGTAGTQINMLIPLKRRGAIVFTQSLDGNREAFYRDSGARPVQLGNPGTPVGIAGTDENFIWYTQQEDGCTGRLVERRLRDSSEKILSEGHCIDRMADVPPPQSLRIAAADGTLVPAYFWRPTYGPLRGVLIEVHGGKHGQYTRDWSDGVGVSLSQGVAVLRLNHRGSTGYGHAFEELAGTPAQDVAAAVDYVRDVLHIPTDRVTLLAWSTGCTVIANYLESSREKFRSVVLVAILSSVPKISYRRGPLFFFHGENDWLLSSSDARKRHGKSGAFRELPREGHMPARLRSWARLYTELSLVP